MVRCGWFLGRKHKESLNCTASGCWKIGFHIGRSYLFGTVHYLSWILRWLADVCVLGSWPFTNILSFLWVENIWNIFVTLILYSVDSILWFGFFSYWENFYVFFQIESSWNLKTQFAVNLWNRLHRNLCGGDKDFGQHGELIINIWAQKLTMVCMHPVITPYKNDLYTRKRLKTFSFIYSSLKWKMFV